MCTENLQSEDEFWETTYENMQERVDKAIIQNALQNLNNDAFVNKSVIYSAFEDWKDNLNEVAVKGRVQFVEDRDVDIEGEADVFGYSQTYKSRIVEDPTWLEVSVLANEMINTTGDLHHVYLEAIYQINDKFTMDDKSFVKIYRFSMGS